MKVVKKEKKSFDSAKPWDNKKTSPERDGDALARKRIYKLFFERGFLSEVEWKQVSMKEMYANIKKKKKKS